MFETLLNLHPFTHLVFPGRLFIRSIYRVIMIIFITTTTTTILIPSCKRGPET